MLKLVEDEKIDYGLKRTLFQLTTSIYIQKRKSLTLLTLIDKYTKTLEGRMNKYSINKLKKDSQFLHGYTLNDSILEFQARLDANNIYVDNLERIKENIKVILELYGYKFEN